MAAHVITALPGLHEDSHPVEDCLLWPTVPADNKLQSTLWPMQSNPLCLSKSES